ncbi:MAG TPA: peroxidase [Gemmatimonadetes bacterium]|nr:peroxidase [Gemmatimonadota bacterium]HCW79151.1 peroxidase [Gemmatimonadota bacterium]
MLHYARLLTRSPASIECGDIDRLRELGFEDRAILDICQVVSYYNYVNRLADGLGVELEDSWGNEDMVMTRAEFEAARG